MMISRDSALTAANVYVKPTHSRFKAENRSWQGIPSLGRTDNGRLFVTFYSGMKTEESGNFVILVQSDDDGQTWKDAVVAIEHPDPEMRVFDPQVWLDPLGRIWLIWAQSRTMFDGRDGVWAIVSENADADTPSWSLPKRIANGIMMNKPTVLSNGEWLFPAAVWTSKYHKPTESHPEVAHEVLSNVYVSCDYGNSFTWRGGADVENRAFDEHMVVEKLDNTLWMLVRAKYGIGQSFSQDAGRTWSKGEPSGIMGPNSRFFIRRLSSGRLLLVYHDSEDNSRKNLTAKLSDDDGKTWSAPLLLDERNNVSYPDGVQDENGRIYIVYDRERYVDREILMAVFTEEDIIAGKCVSSDARLKVLVSVATGPKSR